LKINHLDVVTTGPNLNDEADDIHMVLPEGWPHRHQDTHLPPIIDRVRKALFRHRQAPPLWHNDINTFLLSFRFTQ
jgi:hypothetical protein